MRQDKDLGRIDPRDSEQIRRREATSPRRLSGPAQYRMASAQMGALSRTPGARMAFVEVHQIVAEHNKTESADKKS